MPERTIVREEDLVSEKTSPQLNKEQQEVVRLVEAGKNCFFSGGAGVGKTFCASIIIEKLRQIYSPEEFDDRVAICGPTGLSASHLGGITIHSKSGIGVPKYAEDFSKMWGKVSKNEKEKLWAGKLRHLFLDECSMIPGEMLDRMDQVIRKMCSYSRDPNVSARAHEAFGGMQIILCGDPMQLPAIEASYDPEMQTRIDKVSADESEYKQRGENKILYASRGRFFESNLFWSANLHCVVLKQVYRQKDKEFAAILNALRRCVDENDPEAKRAISILNTQCRRNLPRDKNLAQPVELFPKNSDVDRINTANYRKIKNTEYFFETQDAAVPFVIDSQQDIRLEKIRKQFKDFIVPSRLALKHDTSILLLMNIELPSLFNGRQGIVHGWASLAEMFKKAKSLARGLRDSNKEEEKKKYKWTNAMNQDELDISPDTFKKCVESIGDKELEEVRRWVYESARSRDSYVDKAAYADRREKARILWLLRLGASDGRAPWIYFPKTTSGLSERREIIIADVFEKEACGYGIARRIQVPLTYGG
uniref:ATP-dependent DNA helicase n=2 Tax=Aureoumbra lagunensis TaxID=44058 RepID=A0A7S3JQR6_9STRA